MLRNLNPWQKQTLRLFAWGCLFGVVWAICQDPAFAQGHVGKAVEEGPAEDGFLSSILRSIFLFDTELLMRTLSQPQYTIAAFIALNVIVFVETGLLIGFFLPGDSLLVITGLICANEACGWNMPLLLFTLSASAILGDTVGYGIGFSTGPKIFNREKSFFFHKDHLLKAQQFYEKYGAKTIVLARFVPFLRTFAPVVAGVGKMEYKQFLLYNVMGGVGWVFSMVMAGYFLPSLLNPMISGFLERDFFIEKHIEKVVVLVVFLSVLPMIFAWLKSKLGGKSRPSMPPAVEKEALLSAK